MYSEVLTASLYGLEAEITRVEVEADRGLPAFNVVGLADQSIKEAKERIRAAVENSGCSFRPCRLTVNLSPADRRKEGNHYDLPIALGVLAATGQLGKGGLPENCAFMGELTLSGKLMPATGALSMLIGLQKKGIRRVVVPRGNLKEAFLVKGLELLAPEDLSQLIEMLENWENVKPVKAEGATEQRSKSSVDFADIKGQESVKRAVQLAAAGMHGLLMVGAAGVGKSMVGKRIPGILPPLSFEEQLDVTQIYSACGMLSDEMPMITERPFRAPHHSVTGSSLVGGGTRPRPGEISLAHCGVLFLDELAEFSPRTLDLLRQPLEDGVVSITRLGGRITYPCRFMLAAAMNPCRCGNYGDPLRVCTCTETDRKRYLGRVSGPLLDRIDIHVRMERPDYSLIETETNAPSAGSATLRQGVMRAYEAQRERYKGTGISSNASVPPQMIQRYCALNNDCRRLAEDAFVKWKLSARSYHRILKVARTAADVEGSENIREEHLLEALSLRLPDGFKG